MRHITIQRRTVKIQEGRSAFINVKWAQGVIDGYIQRFKKKRLPRKRKKAIKKQGLIAWNNYCLEFKPSFKNAFKEAFSYRDNKQLLNFLK